MKNEQKIDLAFEVGDSIKIVTKDLKQKKVHPAPFIGIVIAFQGKGTNRTFTVRKIGTNQIAVERIFPLNSPHIESVTVVKKNKVRRANLSYIKNRRTLL